LIFWQFAGLGREQAERSSGNAAKQAADAGIASPRLLVAGYKNQQARAHNGLNTVAKFSWF
jgi:hypothetical protein